MSKNKNILFITHHNNDFDHFLPLIVHLKKDEEIRVKILAFYTKHEILKNRLHKYICDSNDINLDSMTDISYFKWINRAVIKIYKYVIAHRKLSDPGRRVVSSPNIMVKSSRQNESKFKKIKWKIVKFIESPDDTFLKFLEFILIRYLVLCSIFLLTKNKMMNYIDSNYIDLAIIDHRVIDESLIDSNPVARFINVFTGKADPMDHVLFRFAKTVRERKIPIFMVPHGPQPILIPDANRGYLSNPFSPDFLVVSSNNDLIVHPHMQSIKSTLFLGDPRFDIDWINYLESCALKVYEGIVEKPKDKIVLLHILDNAVYSSDRDYKLELHKDVLSLVNFFTEIELWVKHHPRYVFEIPIDDFIHKDRQKNIRQFGNDTDTNILIANADICISAGSTTIISPILQRRPVIFYKKWKEIQDSPSVYDDLKFNASSKEELIVQCQRIINGEYAIDDSFLESFYKNVFSGDSLYECMVEKYSEKIKEVVLA